METVRKLLVPVDFTPHSDNALQYAAALAKEFGDGKLLIFHAYHVPVAVTESGQVLMPQFEEELREITAEKFQALEERILSRYNVPYEFIGEYGAAVPDLVELAQERKAHMIVMPAHPGSAWEEYLGNVTTTVIERKVAPVLVVPENAGFVPPRSFVMATDCKGGEEMKQLEFLKSLVLEFQGRLVLLHAEPEIKDMPEDKALELLALKDAFKPEQPQLAMVEAEDAREGILNYVKEHAADWLVVVPREHGVFYRVLNRSTTHHLAFHTPLPLLVLV